MRQLFFEYYSAFKTKKADISVVSQITSSTSYNNKEAGRFVGYMDNRFIQHT